MDKMQFTSKASKSVHLAFVYSVYQLYDLLGHPIRHYLFSIFFRYATTLVTSQVFNPESKAREVYMTVILPETAFISRFAIEVGGQLFVAYVKEKEDAWKEYQEAVSQGKTAGT